MYGSSKPAISVISLTWNSAAHVTAMLSSLLRDSVDSAIAIEIIVVDNGSSDGTLELLRGFLAQAPCLTVIPLGKNLGTTAPRNIGVRMARGDYVLVLDSDTEIPSGTLRGLLDSVLRIPDPSTLGIVCPRLVYPNGTFQESARRFPTVFTKAYRLLQLEELRQRDESLRPVLEGRMTRVDYAISAAWFLPRATFERVGLLDERIFYAPEDVEFCARVARAGLCVWYYPAVEIVHNCQRLTHKRPISWLGASHTRGLLRYWLEHGTLFSRPRVAELEPGAAT